MSSRRISDLMSVRGVKSTKTRSGWCLQEGLTHVYERGGGKIATLIDKHGLPAFYSCLTDGSKLPCRHTSAQHAKAPSTSFESLCRTISGQFVSGYAALAAWKKLLTVTSNNLTPERILKLVSTSCTGKPDDVCQQLVESKLQKPVGITRNKARSIVDLACHFHDGRLSEEYLDTAEDEEDIRKALLSVNGLGPWSCDMFLIFYLERPNILPLGDLGVRKGISRHFGLKGCLKGGQLCPRKDRDKILSTLADYQPYSSLLAYYMWKAADTPMMVGDETPKAIEPSPSHTVSSEKTTREASTSSALISPTVTPRKRSKRSEDVVATTPRAKRSISRKVTP